MTGLGPHAAYIVASYLGVALVVAGLIAATVLDARRQHKRLAELEAATASAKKAPGTQ